MKIEFDPTNLEEKQEVQSYLTHGKYASAIDEIYNKARGVLKHCDHDDNKVLLEALEEIKKIAAIAHFNDELDL